MSSTRINDKEAKKSTTIKKCDSILAYVSSFYELFKSNPKAKKVIDIIYHYSTEATQSEKNLEILKKILDNTLDKERDKLINIKADMDNSITLFSQLEKARSLLPINTTDVFYGELIDAKNSIIVSTGHQFDIYLLAHWVKTKNAFINPYTNNLFSADDQAAIIAFANSKEDIDITLSDSPANELDELTQDLLRDFSHEDTSARIYLLEQGRSITPPATPPETKSRSALRDQCLFSDNSEMCEMKVIEDYISRGHLTKATASSLSQKEKEKLTNCSVRLLIHAGKLEIPDARNLSGTQIRTFEHETIMRLIQSDKLSSHQAMGLSFTSKKHLEEAYQYIIDGALSADDVIKATSKSAIASLLDEAADKIQRCKRSSGIG